MSGRKKGNTKQEQTLHKLYKNMPLDSYQQFRTVSEIYTDKGNIYQYLQQFFHMWAWGGYTLLRVTVMKGVWCDGEQLSVNCVHCVCMFYLLKKQ